MRTVLTISDSVEMTQFDLSRSIATIKDLELDPLAVVPTFFREDNSSDSFDVTENIDFVFSECEFDAIKIGYLTNIDVMNYFFQKLDGNKKAALFSEPSLISDNGDILVSEDIYEAVCSKVAPNAKLLIINSFEAELLAEFECPNATDYLKAAEKIYNIYGCNVFIKASERTVGKAVLFDGFSSSFVIPKIGKLGFDSEKYNLATAIVCFCVKGKSITDAVDCALDFCAGNFEKPSEVVSAPAIETPVVEAPVVEETKPIEVKKEEPKKPFVMPEFKVPTISMPKSEVPKFSFSFDKKEEVKPVEEPKEEVVEAPKLTVSENTTSLVSPSKSIRELLRGLDLETPDTEPAVTTTIEKPAPGPLGEVSDLAKPSLRIKNDVANSLTSLEELKNRLNSLTGSENK